MNNRKNGRFNQLIEKQQQPYGWKFQSGFPRKSSIDRARPITMAMRPEKEVLELSGR